MASFISSKFVAPTIKPPDDKRPYSRICRRFIGAHCDATTSLCSLERRNRWTVMLGVAASGYLPWRLADPPAGVADILSNAPRVHAFGRPLLPS